MTDLNKNIEYSLKKDVYNQDESIARYKEALEKNYDKDLLEKLKQNLINSFNNSSPKKSSKPVILPKERELRIKELLSLELWDENQIAEYLNMKVSSIRNMATRNEIPGLKRINRKKWRVHVATFIEWFKEPKKEVKVNRKSINKLRL